MPLNNAGMIADYGTAGSRGRLIRCAQPDLGAFQMLYRGRPFVSIRLSNPDEGGVTQAEEVSAASMCRGRVVHAPIGYPIATKAQLIAAADEIERWLAQGYDVYVHCARGHDRTRAAIIAWQVRFARVLIDVALAMSEPFFATIDCLIDEQHTILLREIAAEAA